MNERRVQVTITIDMGQSADACDAATLVGHVREALTAHENTANWYGGKLIGLVGEVPGDPDSVHRWGWRAAASSTIAS